MAPYLLSHGWAESKIGAVLFISGLVGLVSIIISMLILALKE